MVPVRNLPEDKITTAPRRRRIGGVWLRAEYFGDLITADHKVLTEGCVSRNNHRYAVVVQDLATQRIQSYQCKTKTSEETERSLQMFLELSRKPKIIYSDNVFEFGKACEDLSWIIVRRPLTIQKQMGLLTEQYAELMKGHLLYCCNRVRMKKGGRCPWNVTAIYEIFKISCLMGRHRMKGDGQGMGFRWQRTRGGGTRRGEGRINVLPWYRLQLDAKEEEPGCPQG